MRLYSCTGAAAVDDAAGHFKPADDGGFDFPDDLAAHLHAFHASGRQLWETYAERQRRLITEAVQAESRDGPG